MNLYENMAGTLKLPISQRNVRQRAKLRCLHVYLIRQDKSWGVTFLFGWKNEKVWHRLKVPFFHILSCFFGFAVLITQCSIKEHIYYEYRGWNLRNVNDIWRINPRLRLLKEYNFVFKICKCNIIFIFFIFYFFYFLFYIFYLFIN